MKGFQSKRKSKQNNLERHQHRHEYEIDTNINEEEQKKTESLQKAMLETPRGSWASRLLIFYI